MIVGLYVLNFVDVFFPRHATPCCSILSHIVTTKAWLYFSTFDGITFLSWDSDFIVTDFIVTPSFFPTFICS